MHSVPVFLIRALGKRYRAGVAGCWAEARALVDVNLDIRGGEVVAVVGASGAGKTTLLRCAARLLAPDEGFVEHTKRADGEESVARYFADCIHAERAAAVGETWDLALIDDVDRVGGDVAAAFALEKVLTRAKRDGAAMLLATRDLRIVREVTDRTLRLEDGRLADESGERRTLAAAGAGSSSKGQTFHQERTTFAECPTSGSTTR